MTATDVVFVYFTRIYYQRRAPRSEEPAGTRVEVKDRQGECRCLRFSDWSRIKLKRLRQIEVSYPAGERAARVRLTYNGGRLREFSAADLFGSEGPVPPRLAATVGGRSMEFPLVLRNGPEARWPEETLVRLLFLRSRSRPHR